MGRWGRAMRGRIKTGGFLRCFPTMERGRAVLLSGVMPYHNQIVGIVSGAT
jgi:hypothetical protein